MAIIMEFRRAKGIETHERVKRLNVESVFFKFCKGLRHFRENGANADSSGAMKFIIQEINLLNLPRGQRQREGFETVEIALRLQQEEFHLTDPAGNPLESFFSPIGFRFTSSLKHQRLDNRLIKSHPSKRQLEGMYGSDWMNRNLYAIDYISTVLDELVIFVIGRITFVTFFQTLKTNLNTCKFVVTFVPYGTGVKDDPSAFRTSSMDYLIIDNRVHAGSMTPIIELLLGAAKRRIPMNNLSQLVGKGQPLVFRAMTALSGYMDSSTNRPQIEEMSRLFKDIKLVEPALDVEHPGILRTLLLELKS